MRFIVFFWLVFSVASLSSQTVRDNMACELIFSNDVCDLLRELDIKKPRKCVYENGKRIKVCVKNEGNTMFGKSHMNVYYGDRKIFKTRLPNLNPGEEFQFAINMEKQQINLYDLTFKVWRKKTYRVYRLREE